MMRTARAFSRCILAACALALLGMAGVATPARAAEALVAVAANFAEAIEELAPAFEDATGHRLVSTTGSTGKLYAQIVAGAPFDVLLAADAATPQRLEAEGFAVPGTRFTYAIGGLTLWSSDPERIAGDDEAALTAEDVRHIATAADVRHIAIANPDLAPYGVAARETLQSLGLWDALKAKIVMGQNIGQVHSMVATGNAELGFVALSAVLSPRAAAEGSRWDVLQDLFTPIRQDAILLKTGAENESARAFIEFLATAPARVIVERYGYGVERP